MPFEPRNPDFASRIRESFEKQDAMHSLGGSIQAIEPGRVILSMPFKQAFTQQHGFVHAGIITTMLDSAAGYAAFSLMPSEAAVLTVEFKTSLLAPAQGVRFRFDGRVIKPGRTLTFCEADAFAISANDQERKIATMTATMMAVIGRETVKD